MRLFRRKCRPLSGLIGGKLLGSGHISFSLSALPRCPVVCGEHIRLCN